MMQVIAKNAINPNEGSETPGILHVRDSSGERDSSLKYSIIVIVPARQEVIMEWSRDDRENIERRRDDSQRILLLKS